VEVAAVPNTLEPAEPAAEPPPAAAAVGEELGML